MQTFLPYPDFRQSAHCLDTKRLGKQRVETLQILNALHGKTDGWVNHPATKMWRGYEQALVEYGIVFCDTWIALGYKDTCKDKIAVYRRGHVVYPSWLGGYIHRTHKAALLHKKYDFYAQYDWDKYPNYVPVEENYYWPI